MQSRMKHLDLKRCKNYNFFIFHNLHIKNNSEGGRNQNINQSVFMAKYKTHRKSLWQKKRSTLNLIGSLTIEIIKKI